MTAVYHLNVGGASWSPFEASSDEEAMRIACAILDRGPFGDPEDGPALISAGVFDPDDQFVGEVSVHVD
jgi:hypothetical protein